MDKILDRSKSPKTKEFYEFGGFSLEVEKRRLWRGEELVALTPKEFEVLFYLIKRSGQVAEKDELLDAIWTDTFVEETTLARNVSWLRKKLDAGANGEKFIETVPKRGYRFIAEVTRRQAEIAPVENDNALDFENEDALFIEDEDALIVEEESVRHLSIERTITLTPERPAKVPSSEFRVPTSNLQLPPKDKGQRTKNKVLLFVLAFVAFTGIAFAVYQIYFQNNRPNVVVASSVVPFSGAAGRENTMTFSPDGKQIAYAWNGGEGNTLDLYVRLVGGAGEPVRLTKTDITEQYPTYSPDGSQIAFVREFKDHGEIVLIPALGGAELRVARLFSGNYSISFSPDGKNIAVIDTENSDGNESKQYAVYLVNIETGERRRVTNPAEFAGETTPRFSPDGKSLAFVRISKNQKQDLFVVPTSGGEPRQITFDEKTIHSLTWSANGQEIYFVSYRGSNQASIWRVPAAGGTPEIISTGGKDITNVAASPNGKTIAFVENTFNSDIWRTTANNPTATKLISSTFNEYEPQFSPDSSRIIFVADRSKKHEIWTADADGKNQRQLTDTPRNVGSPRFSPDGSRIVFYTNDGETSKIFTMSAEGGAAQPLISDKTQYTLPVWSADGKYIYFTSNRTGENNIWKIPASGGEAVQITKNGAFRAAPAPDGKMIFYVKAETSDGLWRVPAEGGSEESVHELADALANKWLMSHAAEFIFSSASPTKVSKSNFTILPPEKLKKRTAIIKYRQMFKEVPARTPAERFFYIRCSIKTPAALCSPNLNNRIVFPEGSRLDKTIIITNFQK